MKRNYLCKKKKKISGNVCWVKCAWQLGVRPVVLNTESPGQFLKITDVWAAPRPMKSACLGVDPGQAFQSSPGGDLAENHAWASTSPLSQSWLLMSCVLGVAWIPGHVDLSSNPDSAPCELWFWTRYLIIGNLFSELMMIIFIIIA